jgi:small conductance mechanosensitive channel
MLGFDMVRQNMTLPLQTSPNGAIAKLLADQGVPFAAAMGSTITFLITLVIVYLLGQILVLPLLTRIFDAQELDRHLRSPIQKITRAVIVFVAFAVAFGLAGFGNILTSLATIGAAATLALGFALQDVIKNFVAGIFIFTGQPFRIGDWIEWDGYAGIVEDISLRVTRLRTFDNELLTVPNSHLTTNVIKNPVAKGTLRFKVVFDIDYGDDIQQATDIIIEEATSHEDILDEPGPSVRLTELDDSSVGLQARLWISNPDRTDYTRVRGEYVTAVKNRFDAEDITMPYPQRTLSGDLTIPDQSSPTEE